MIWRFAIFDCLNIIIPCHAIPFSLINHCVLMFDLNQDGNTRFLPELGSQRRFIEDDFMPLPIRIARWERSHRRLSRSWSQNPDVKGIPQIRKIKRLPRWWRVLDPMVVGPVAWVCDISIQIFCWWGPSNVMSVKYRLSITSPNHDSVISAFADSLFILHKIDWNIHGLTCPFVDNHLKKNSARIPPESQSWEKVEQKRKSTFVD